MANFVFTGLQDFANQQNKVNAYHQMTGRSLSPLDHMTPLNNMNEGRSAPNFNSVNQVISTNPVFTPQNVPIGLIDHPSITFRPSPTPNSIRMLSSTVASSASSPVASSTNLYQSAIPLTTASENRPFFHVDATDTILFESWVLETAFETLITCVLFLLLAIALEGIKFYREHLLKQFTYSVEDTVAPVTGVRRSSSSHMTLQRKEHYSVDPQVPNLPNQQFHGPEPFTSRTASFHSNCSRNAPVSKNGDSPTIGCRNKLLFSNGHFKIRLISLAHLIQTCLHLIQLLLTYVLIMAMITFNTYICLSIVLGSTLGYWLFFWRKVTIMYDENTSI